MMIDRNQSPLISPDDLLGLQGQPNLKIFDVRGGWGTDDSTALADYNRGHITEAVLLDWRKYFIENGVEPGLASVANYDEACASFRKMGISDNDVVVLYDDYHHMQAGRIWWALQHWGFSNVRVLNGGWNNWRKMGLEVSTEPGVVKTGSFKPVINPSMRVNLSTVAEQLGRSYLIDARSPAGYAGVPNEPRTGHIPSAINIPYSLVLDEKSGCFKSDDALVDVFEHKLRKFGSLPIISSCGSGYAGTVILLALRKLGIHAPLYDGSFAEWKQDAGRMIEQAW